MQTLKIQSCSCLGSARAFQTPSQAWTYIVHQRPVQQDCFQQSARAYHPTPIGQDSLAPPPSRLLRCGWDLPAHGTCISISTRPREVGEPPHKSNPPLNPNGISPCVSRVAYRGCRKLGGWTWQPVLIGTWYGWRAWWYDVCVPSNHALLLPLLHWKPGFFALDSVCGLWLPPTWDRSAHCLLVRACVRARLQAMRRPAGFLQSGLVVLLIACSVAFGAAQHSQVAEQLPEQVCHTPTALQLHLLVHTV